MSKWYPATQMSIGNWDLFSVRLTFEDLKKNISFAHDIETPSVLDDFYQRKLNESRAKKDIVNYLLYRDDSFFNSLVIACLGDLPEFIPIKPNEELLKDLKIDKDEVLGQGFFRFSATQKYFVLDGQHRMFAIKEILEDPDNMDIVGPEFLDQHINALVVTRGEGEDQENFKQKYRRLFTSLNRYAKPTDQTTNIIMDEDDAFAILTRRLILELDEFRNNSSEGAVTNPSINIERGTMQSGLPHFTNLVSLYKINQSFLTNRIVRNNFEGIEMREYITMRPSDEDLDALFGYLKNYWNTIFNLFPELANKGALDRTHMRSHNAPLESDLEMDHGLLWPIVQTNLFAPLVKHLISNYGEDDDIEMALQDLKKIEWDLRKPPFRNLILINTTPNADTENWTMPSQNRNAILDQAYNLCLFLLDDGNIFNQTRTEQLKADIFVYLSLGDRAEKESWWEDVLNLKEEIHG